MTESEEEMRIQLCKTTNWRTSLNALFEYEKKRKKSM